MLDESLVRILARPIRSGPSCRQCTASRPILVPRVSPPSVPRASDAITARAEVTPIVLAGGGTGRAAKTDYSRQRARWNIDMPSFRHPWANDSRHDSLHRQPCIGNTHRSRFTGTGPTACSIAAGKAPPASSRRRRWSDRRASVDEVHRYGIVCPFYSAFCYSDINITIAKER